jgi:hypothetical protein
MFPKAKKSGLDMEELGARIVARKQDLKAEMGIEDEAEAPEFPPGHGSGNSVRTTHAGRS